MMNWYVDHLKYNLQQFLLVYVAQEMNVESSGSHLIVGIIVESRNLSNGSMSTSKLSLVDLAGSERAAKTGAKEHQRRFDHISCPDLRIKWV